MARLIEIRAAIFVILEVYIMVKNKEINKIDSSHVSAEQIINEIQNHTEIFRSLTGEAFIKAMMQNYKELLTEYYYLMEQEVTDKG